MIMKTRNKNLKLRKKRIVNEIENFEVRGNSRLEYY